MKFKTYLTAVLFLSISFFLPVSAIAETALIGIEIPSTYQFDSSDDGGKLSSDGAPSGFMVYAQFPALGTFGIETYEIKLADYSDSSITTEMLDYSYNFLLPFLDISLGLGAGIGQSRVKGSASSQFSTNTSSQYFVNFGLPIFAAAQIRFSYHRVINQIPRTGGTYLEASGVMTSFGIGIGL